jgi:hypothetical protein
MVSLNSSGLLEKLNNATRTKYHAPTGRLYGGDLKVAVSILTILVNDNHLDNSTEKDQQNFLDICSNILDPINSNSWIQYEDQKKKVSLVRFHSFSPSEKNKHF